ncbi:MAG: transglutaminase-like domain-containing protein [Nanoarchaeota archaeon]
MRKIILTILLLALPFAYAENLLYNSEELIIGLSISSTAKLIPLSSNYDIKYVILNLSFIPFNDTNQRVLTFETLPTAERHDNYIQLIWDAPRETNLNFLVTTDVVTYNHYIPITSKVGFPIKDIPDDVVKYTFPSPTIDSDNLGIVKKASELAEGEDDLFKVVYNLATWSKSNIKYDLSTLTAEVSQKASWVLNNKQGVCDELTSLFIAMSRSLGIPAKFISGIAYTESALFPDKWGPHGWAEIYFPDYGWVPFDVTYGEYGYVDPTHIKLKESIDPDVSSSNYEWLGTNIGLIPEKLKIKAEVKKISKTLEPQIKINVDSVKKSIGFSSYNLIKAEIENLAEYYVSSEFQIVKPKEIEVVDDVIKPIMLKPRETKQLFWMVRLGELFPDYVYTFPIIINNADNITGLTNFTAMIDSKVYTFNEIHNTMQDSLEEEKKYYSKNLDLLCEIDNEMFYEDETTKLKCNVRNIVNVVLRNLSFCVDYICENFELGIGRTINRSIDIQKYPKGQNEITVNVKNTDVAKSSYVKFNVLDKPNVSIENVTYPESIEFDDRFTVSFLIKKISISEPKNVKIRIAQNNFAKEWDFDALSEDRELILTFEPHSLNRNENKFEVSVGYSDALGRKYSTKNEWDISLRNLTLIQRLAIGINRIGEFIVGIF